MANDQRPPHHDFDKAIEWLYHLRSTGYYGGVLFKFDNGQIVSVCPTPLCKPGEDFPAMPGRKRIGAVG